MSAITGQAQRVLDARAGDAALRAGVLRRYGAAPERTAQARDVADSHREFADQCRPSSPKPKGRVMNDVNPEADKVELRMRCLDIAARSDRQDVLEEAKRFYAFAIGEEAGEVGDAT